MSRVRVSYACSPEAEVLLLVGVSLLTPRGQQKGHDVRLQVLVDNKLLMSQQCGQEGQWFPGMH